MHWWRDAAAREGVQRSRRRPRKPGIRSSQQQGSHQALLRRRQPGVKQQDPGQDHPPPSSDGPADLRLCHAAVEKLPTSGET
jgi:hypothetical protein